MKTIKVVAAIIIDNGKVFATQRGYGEFKDGWEFPGGKIEEGETAREAIVREIREELDTEIQVEELLDTVEYDYPKFHLSMDCFVCRVKSGFGAERARGSKVADKGDTWECGMAAGG